MKTLKNNQPEFKVQSGGFAGTVYKRDVHHPDWQIPAEFKDRFVTVKKPTEKQKEKSK